MKKLFQNLMFATMMFAASTTVHAQVAKWLLTGNSNATALSKLGTTNAFDVNLITDNITRMTVKKTSGYIGIGTTVPTSKLEVAGGDARINSITVGLGGGFVANNTAFGSSALASNTTGYTNTAVGFQSLYSNNVGSNNTASGYHTLYFNTTGGGNTAIGYSALFSNSNGFENTAIGIFALTSNTTGDGNTATGNAALSSNTSGFGNTATGIFTLNDNTTGYNNTSDGYEALYSNTTGYYNTALGYIALYSNTTGYCNTALGFNAFFNGLTYHNSTALGCNAPVTASNQVYIGDASVTGVYCFSGVFTGSDGRFKNTIEENVPGLSFITKLRPVTYHYDMDKIAEILKTPDSHRLKDSEANKSKVLYSGFIAQEVEKSASEIGYDFSGVSKPKNDNDFYAIDYAEFVVPLVKSVQELSKQNDEMKLQNDEMRSQLAAMQSEIDALKSGAGSSVDSKSGVINFSAARLDQISPNPFSQKATITFTLPADVSIAQLLITDVSGKVIATYSISNGSTEQVINANTFDAGVYQYSLMVNGKMVDAKQMVIVK